MKFFEVFKAGNYPQGVFSENDIEILAKNYDPSFCEAPITLDHEQKGPAYGWVSGLKSENGKLKASFRDVAGELKEFVQSGKYKKISIEMYKELEGKKPYLKAVSFLGAAIPQVKGMQTVEFKEGESEIYVFEIEEPESNPEIIKLQEQIKDLEEQVKVFADKKPESKSDERVIKLQDKVKELSDQVNKFQEGFKEKQKAEKELRDLKFKIRQDGFENFLNEQISSGNLIPSQKDLSLKIFAALDNVQKFNESDHIEEFKQFLKTLPKQVEFSEIATKKKQKNGEEEIIEFTNASEESISVYNEAKQLSEKENIPFKDALLRIYE